MGVQFPVLHENFISGPIHRIIPGHRIPPCLIPADPVPDGIEEGGYPGAIPRGQDCSAGLMHEGLSLALMEEFQLEALSQIPGPGQDTTRPDPGAWGFTIQALPVEQIINFPDQPGIHASVKAFLAFQQPGLPCGRQAIEIIDIGWGSHFIAEPGIFHAETMVGSAEPIQRSPCRVRVLEQVIKDFGSALPRSDQGDISGPQQFRLPGQILVRMEDQGVPNPDRAFRHPGQGPRANHQPPGSMAGYRHSIFRSDPDLV